MRITPLRSLEKSNFIDLNDSMRKLFIVKLENVSLTGRNIHYPNCLVSTKINDLINPYDEKVMSLNKESFYDNNEYSGEISISKSVCEEPCFFFVYNVDNYYHFIYDTLPILYSYFLLLKDFPSLQLLIQTSHPSKQKLSPFVTQFLESFNIKNIRFAVKEEEYKTLFVSTSFTHGGQSNEKPSALAYSVWNKPERSSKILPKRFYISRRSWLHGKTDNIGTNYTTRRKCMNEDELVERMKKYGIEEIFTELLTTEEKLSLFAEAEVVVGIIGGGMCNLLFSPPQTKSLCITTPHFLTINERFQHSMNHTQILYSNTASLAPYEGNFPLYSRVKVKESGKVGEILEYKEGKNKVSLSSNDVAGFSQDFPMEEVWNDESKLEPVDHGLNSPFLVDTDRFENDLKTLLSL